ncbi:hypothetical protein [Candidatus Nanohalobium constans]|uniref:Uncharacterized protein n=1 Tax=Candidatus Nanohalobium constans TaxID=2565781 RepID=A0A5Q0UHA6_9ARCH|nr:hypothetical protein [Candidatus Nanohalobium constans]QGA80335.1 hypothetical protein LC1Nh_0434 [Candidatus Nanohalobium constans]
MGDGKVVDEVKKKSWRNKKLKEASLAIGLVLLGGLAAFMLWSGTEDTPDSYADAGSDTVHKTQMDAAEVFNITDIGVAPASHTVKLGKSVGFRNKLGSEISITFDRSNDTIEIPSGKSETLLINGITYFQISGNDYSAQGRVNVQ